ncbi:DUF6461 domain-containing protein [Dactylosporangium sp. CA-152071]|uniref:DUF6461 domain-containing protein n=1 Tax=Dactylosporangium sp. CA-152071 TaxID=3239933 RepID=UPI003D8B946E
MVAGVEQVLPLDFCVTLVRGAGPDEVIGILGGADPVPIVSAQTALLAEDAVRERVDEHGVPHPSDLMYVVATRLGDWTMVIEPNGYLCTDRDVVRALSAAGELVSFYYNENTTPSFTWAAGGRELVYFNPGYPDEPYGAEPGRLDGLLTELGFTFGGYGDDPDEDDDDFDADFQERTFALMERMTGVRWDAEHLHAATFRCAGVGGPGSQVAAEPWYAEVREALEAYVADPGDWTGEDFEGWGRRGVTDRRVRALGSAGPAVYDEDRAMAMAIAFAPAELIGRIFMWAWERPFRAAGLVDEPWFGRVRDLVHRGEPVPAQDVQVVEQALDPYLATTVFLPFRQDRAHRANIARGLVVQWDSVNPAADLCWQFARTGAADGRPMPQLFADLWRDFPELRDVVIPQPQPPPRERDAVRRKREARERDAERWRLEDLRNTWGGRIPADPRLLEPDVQSATLGLVPHDRDLIDRIAEAGPRTQRAMAAWAARYCCTRSGMIAEDWVEAGVTALERGAPPPPWFTDFDAAFARWRDVPVESITHRLSVSFGDHAPPPIDPAVFALQAVVMARDDDPLIAAMATVRDAMHLGDPAATSAAFRAAFDLP